MNKRPDLVKRSIISKRIHNQKLAAAEFAQPADVVRWMGAVQAQEFHAAKWALALRMREPTSASIQDAFDRGEILRTHVLRPTWHFVTPQDIRWLLELTAPRVHVRCGSAYRKYEVDGAAYKKACRVLVKALQGGKHLTRTELKAALYRVGIDANDTVRMGHILIRAELDRLICSGPIRGKQFTYALFDERVPPAKPLDPDEALARLTVRYFSSHGPATLQDFVWWSGLTTADARRGIGLAGNELTTLNLAENVYWTASLSLTRNRHPDGDRRASVVRANFLPAYDEYNVAYKHRELVSNVLGPTAIVDGRIIGTWTARLDHGSVLIHVTPSHGLNQSQKRLLTTAADSYGAYLKIPARVAYGLK